MLSIWGPKIRKSLPLGEEVLPRTWGSTSSAPRNHFLAPEARVTAFPGNPKESVRNPSKILPPHPLKILWHYLTLPNPNLGYLHPVGHAESHHRDEWCPPDEESPYTARLAKYISFQQPNPHFNALIWFPDSSGSICTTISDEKSKQRLRGHFWLVYRKTISKKSDFHPNPGLCLETARIWHAESPPVI